MAMASGHKFANFFPSVSDSSVQQQSHDLPAYFNSRRALLVGPPRSGKTSLLFQFCYNCARESGSRSHVVFICQKKRIENGPPLLSRGVDPSSEVFNRVHMRYLVDDKELRKYLACLHLLPNSQLPTALVIDNFSAFFDQSSHVGGGVRSAHGRAQDMAIARTLALLCDAVDFVRQNDQPICKLLVSDTSGADGPRSLYLFQRWFPLIFHIKALEPGKFSLSVFRDSLGPGGFHVSARYSLLEHCLSLLSLEFVPSPPAVAEK
ncbi:hypothetical protein CBR_g41204 [Chara braunii]|uniref:Uncharacterized protein n=1 Tax=Chara braunii TaxID=69332 RepID=A0A388K2K1_CHABU|nr:hypothetical protein CBR_g41204 [Chara braunii]|eukprot:GBG64284.1 hypothetical protein CBR_g41204 [Chara braunii]